ncbi:vacuolar protein sorting-associated protein 26-domain-containing protein, partial [Schizophyllum commune]
MAAYFFSSPIDIDIKLSDEEARKHVDMKSDKDKDKVVSCPVYYDGEGVGGTVSIRVRDGKKITHDGIKVEFVGTIELFYDRGHHHEFLSLSQELAAPGEMRQAQTFDFNFKAVEKQFESYIGINVKLRYFVRLTLTRRMGLPSSTLTKERDIWVHSFRMPPEANNSIKMEVGIEDCLHIEFEYNKSKYHLKDVIVGKIYFLLVRIKIKHMELSIIRREVNRLTTESIQRVRDDHEVRDYGRRTCTRRNHPHTPLPRRLRPHADLPGREQEVLDPLLPQPRPHRRGEPEILQAAGDHDLPDTR